jgi:uncharacterized protein YacL
MSDIEPDTVPAPRGKSITDWTVSMVLSAIIAMLGFFLVDDRRSASTQRDRMSTELRLVEARIGAVEVQMAVVSSTQRAVLERLMRIEEKIDRHFTVGTR